MGYQNAGHYTNIRMLSSDIIESLCGDLIGHRKLRPEGTAPPGLEWQIPSLAWSPIDPKTDDFFNTAYTPMERPIDLSQLPPPPPDDPESGSIRVGFQKVGAPTGGIDAIRRGEVFTGTTPRYVIASTARLDVIGAIAIQPQTLPNTRVQMPLLQVHCVGPTYPMTLEVATRLAEYIAAYDVPIPDISCPCGDHPPTAR